MNYFKCIVCLLITIMPLICIAQPPAFGGGDDVMDVPLDGGLSILLATGIGYGIQKTKRTLPKKKSM